MPVNKTAAWHGGSATDLLNPPLNLGSERTQFTQSLTIQRNGDEGQKARSASAIEGGLSQNVVRRLDFLNDKLVANKSSVGEFTSIILYLVHDLLKFQLLKEMLPPIQTTSLCHRVLGYGTKTLSWRTGRVLIVPIPVHSWPGRLWETVRMVDMEVGGGGGGVGGHRVSNWSCGSLQRTTGVGVCRTLI